MNYNFVKHINTRDRGNRIKIYKNGILALSSGFLHEVNINNTRYVVFYYDKNNKSIGLQFIKEKIDASFKITRDRSGATVSLKSFMKNFKLDISKYVGSYTWKIVKDKNNDMYVINLAL